MRMSSREKEMIKKIATGAIRDLGSYIQEMTSLKKEPNRWSNFMSGSVSIPMGALVSIVEDEDALARELSVFIALCKRLQEFQLLQVLENSAPSKVPYMLARSESGTVVPSKIYSLVASNGGFEIVAFHELGEFIENDFLTPDERNLREERNAREKAQRTTVVVAVLGLVVSTATSVGVTYFNYKTYTTERKVSISNLDAIKYPLPVSIANAPNAPAIVTKRTAPAPPETLRDKAAQRP